MKTKYSVHGAALGLALALGACATEAPATLAAPAAPEAAAEEMPAAVDYAAIVAAPGRPDADIEADARRKPAEVLSLVTPQAGDVVLEIEAGGGYFTELLSRSVGETGTVYMQNPAGFDAFLGDAVPKRIDGRLNNVTYVKSNFDAYGLEDGSVDIVTWFQGPHELWFFPDDTPEGFGDPAAAFSEIARVLKSGGRFVAIDHVAPAGAPATTGGDTHRIDPALIREMAEAAGLVLETESDLLRNPEDDGTMNVFNPAIRGNTDQALLIFAKP